MSITQNNIIVVNRYNYYYYYYCTLIKIHFYNIIKLHMSHCVLHSLHFSGLLWL